MTTHTLERPVEMHGDEGERRVFDAAMVKVSSKQTGERRLHLAEGGIEGGSYVSGIGIEESNALSSREAEELTTIFRDAIDSKQGAKSADELAVMLDEMQESARDEFRLHNRDTQHRLDRAAVYIVRDGTLIWSAAGSESSLGLVLARADGSVQHLGAEKGSHVGVITDIHPEDKVYTLPNRLMRDMKQTKAFALNGLEMVANEDDIQANIVSVAFDEAYQPTLIKSASATETPVRENQAPKTRDETTQNFRNMKKREEAAARKARQAADKVSGSADTSDHTGDAAPTSPLDTTYPAGSYDSPIGPDMEDGSMAQFTAGAKPDDAYDVKYRKKKGPMLGPENKFKPDDAYAATYDDQYSGPMPAHMPDRAQARQVREFMESDAYKAAHDIYDTADKELAIKVARRLKLGMFTTKKTREASSAEVEAVHVEYERMSETFDALQIEKWRLVNPSLSAADLNTKLAHYHEAKLRLQGLRAQSEILTSKGKFGKISEWNNKLTEKFASLTLPGKIGVAAASLVVGTAVGAAGLAIGGGAAATGAVLLAGAKLYKTSAQSRAGLHRNTAAVDKADFKKSDGLYKSAKELREQSQVTFQKGFEARVKKADHVNKVAKWTTIGSVAMLGAGIAGHIGVVHDIYKAAEDHVGGWLDSLQHPTGAPHHVETGITPSQGGGSGHNPIDKLGSGDMYHAPKIPSSAGITYSPNAMNVSAGEGWYQTFSEMGITNAHEQLNLLNNNTLMTDLANRGLAYRDVAAGGWGMNMTPDGKMPKAALDLIRAYAQKDGYDLAA